MACIFVRSGFPLLEVSNLQKITGWPLWPSGRVQRRTLTKDLQVAFPPHLYLRWSRLPYFLFCQLMEKFRTFFLCVLLPWGGKISLHSTFLCYWNRDCFCETYKADDLYHQIDLFGWPAENIVQFLSEDISTNFPRGKYEQFLESSQQLMEQVWWGEIIRLWWAHGQDNGYADGIILCKLGQQVQALLGWSKVLNSISCGTWSLLDCQVKCHTIRKPCNLKNHKGTLNEEVVGKMAWETTHEWGFCLW